MMTDQTSTGAAVRPGPRHGGGGDPAGLGDQEPARAGTQSVSDF